MPELSLKQWVICNLFLAGVLFLVVFQVFGVHQELAVSVLDVGQGDAILIQVPEYHNILIDSGPDSSAVDRLGDEMGFFDKTIDLFILTHPHRDHYGGILDVMHNFDIKKVILTGVISGDPIYKAFLTEVKVRGVEVIFAQNDQDIQIGQNLYLDLLYPFADRSLVGQDVDNKNNTSVVARLLRSVGDGWKSLVMLTGDAEEELERELLLSGQSLQADVLKVGHHGSRTATSDGFLSAVNPMTAIISVGTDNKFEHPHQETIDKLSDINILRTDIQGTVNLEL